MALGPIELNLMVGRAQDVSAIKQNEDLRPMTEQTAFQNQMEKAEKEQAGQVRRSEETDTRQRRQDASEKGKNEYFGDGGRRRKKNEIPPEGRVIRGKGNGSHFDCSI